jgi:hypothetical protein
MTKDLQLTTDELALILARRAERATEQAARVFQKKAIATANRFMDWSAEHNEGLTFSTFINSFNYQDADGRQMYETVKRIVDAAWPSDFSLFG